MYQWIYSLRSLLKKFLTADLLFLVCFLLSSRFAIGAQEKGETSARGKVFYHWTTIYKAEAWAEWLESRGVSFGKLDFKTDWSNEKRLYVWTNPVTGIVGGYDPDKDPTNGEFYAGRLPDDGLVLFKFELAESARRGIDYAIREELHFHEYHILNPDIIKRFTIDPKELEPEIQEVVRKLKNPEYKFTKWEVHYFNKWLYDIPGVWNDPKFRQVILQKLNEYLSQENLNRLPKYFLEKSKRPSISKCSRIFY